MHYSAVHMMKGLANPPKKLGHGQLLSDQQDVPSGVQEGSVFSLVLYSVPERLERVRRVR